ncbi:uncharacterized protein F4822DRAFT_444955 [Hypoxylon trugodes]|uniref:uncharacterized protein n=1 Tax=Hypoxylon trugodes TaxID=326681 RepID=UPI002196BC32|nr:uncharacterized protein F4822DRAFT_444955 [Hypoxylon trugodes]KAI1386614.1 hypothetical protein F4822DRAFT_444955 [Hypoxylon trugodes]
MPSVKRPHSDLDDRWKQNEAIIRQLYEAKRKTLKEVKQIMEDEYGFPVIPLSTYETKLRDVLRLRKRLKKEDWTPIYQSYLNRGEKDTGIYLNGNRIEWKKAWKEMRRSGARDNVGNSNATTLPVGVEVRTPSPAPRLGPPSPTASLTQQETSPPVFLTYPTTTQVNYEVIPYGLDNILQRHPSQPTAPNLDPEDEFASFFESVKIEYNNALADGPSVVFQNLITPIIRDLMGTTFETHLPKLQEMIFSVIPSFLPRPGQASSLSVPSSKSDVYDLLSRTIYLLSNGLLDEEIGEGPCPKICEILLNQAPQSTLRQLFQQDLPTARATWEALAQCAGRFGFRDAFTFLMSVGFHHYRWVIPNGTSWLIHAAAMGAIDIVRNLLQNGIQLTGPPDEERIAAFLEAIATGNVECAELLIEGCDINQQCYQQKLYVSYFGWFVEALMTGGFISRMRRDHAYVPTLLKDMDDGRVLVKLSLDHQPHSRVLEVFLKRGADVDAAWRAVGSSPSYDFLSHNNRPTRQSLTLLEQSYYYHPKLYYKLRPYSPQATFRILRPAVCIHAKRGVKSLSKYLKSLPDPKERDSRETSFLGLVLAEQFVPTRGTCVDTRVVDGLVAFGVDTKLASSQFILCNFVKLIWVDVLNILCLYGANVNEYGANALSAATRIGNLEAVNWLLERVGSKAQNGIPSTVDSPEHFLNHTKDDDSFFDKAKVFLEKSNDFNPSDHSGDLLEACINPYVPVSSAMAKRRLAVFKLLLNRGASPTDYCLPSLIYHGGQRELIEELLETTDNINAYSAEYRSDPPYTALQSAASRGDKYLVDQLIRRGADVNWPAKEGRGVTALGAAYYWKTTSPDDRTTRLSLLRLLIERGADVNCFTKPDGESVLLLAARDGDMDVVLLLCHYGADLNIVCAIAGILLTPLDEAAKEGRLDVVQLLLNVGAYSYKQGQTEYDGAIEAAMVHKKFAVIDLIWKHVEDTCRVQLGELSDLGECMDI